jgi:uncharacterized repeat protein (TIGR01451 family)
MEICQSQQKLSSPPRWIWTQPIREIITNTVVTSTNAGSGSASAAITVNMPELSLTKTVEAGQLPVQPGDPVTYTLVVRNDSAFDAVGVHIWDELPEGVVGDGVDITVTIGAGTAYTITLPAVLAQNVERGSMIINTAYFESGKLSGDDSVSVAVGDFIRLLSINMKH